MFTYNILGTCGDLSTITAAAVLYGAVVTIILIAMVGKKIINA